MNGRKNKLFLFQYGLCFFLISFFFYLSCTSNDNKQNKNTPYIREIKEWHQKRLKKLKSKNGWLSLAGLYWLEKGENTFGADPSRDFIISKGGVPPFIGTFILNNRDAYFKAKKGVDVRNNGEPVSEIKLQNDASKKPTVLKWGSLSWHIIKRGEKLGVRLRDSEHPRIQKLKKIKTFPINEDWKIEAVFKPHKKPKIIKIPTAIGTIEEIQSTGYLEFRIEDKTYQLHPLGGNVEFFMVFGDKTNTKETYGGGRFLSVQKPDQNGNTFIDLLKSK